MIDATFPQSHQSREETFAKPLGVASATDSITSDIETEGIHPSEPTPDTEVRSASSFRM